MVVTTDLWTGSARLFKILADYVPGAELVAILNKSIQASLNYSIKIMSEILYYSQGRLL